MSISHNRNAVCVADEMNGSKDMHSTYRQTFVELDGRYIHYVSLLPGVILFM